VTQTQQQAAETVPSMYKDVEWEVVYYPFPASVKDEDTFEAMVEQIVEAVNHPVGIFSAWNQDVSLLTRFDREVHFSIEEPIGLNPPPGMPETLDQFQDVITSVLAEIGLEGSTEARRVTTLQREDKIRKLLSDGE